MGGEAAHSGRPGARSVTPCSSHVVTLWDKHKRAGHEARTSHESPYGGVKARRENNVIEPLNR